MADVALNQANTALKTTGLTAAPPDPEIFDGQSVLYADAHAVFAATNPPLAAQDIDGIHARGLNSGCGLTGEGGDNGPGVVGVSGSVIPNTPDIPHDLEKPPFPGRGRLTGVLGLASVGQGVAGESVSGPGVFGRSDSGKGVAGFSLSGTGVEGISNDQIGVYGQGSRIGVSGRADNGRGVSGRVSSGRGVEGITRSGIGVYGEAPPAANERSQDFAGFFKGAVFVEGPITVTGAKSAAVPYPDGSHRLLYCLESPDCWFEDIGEVELVEGHAEVALAPDFAAVVETASYHVFLTPYGDSKGLFVSSRSAKGFEVREQQGGTSNLPFSYRVVARRKDIRPERLAKVTLPGDRASSEEAP